MADSDSDEVPCVEFDDDDYFSGQPHDPTTPKSPPKTLKSRRRKRDKSVSTSKTRDGMPSAPSTSEKTQKAPSSVPPIFQLLGSITGRATDFYNSWTRPSQPPRRHSAATSASFLTAPQMSPLMKDMVPEYLPSVLSVPVNAPPTPPGEDYARFKTQTQTQTQTHKKEATQNRPRLNLNTIKSHVINTAQTHTNTFLASPLLLAGAAVILGLAITVGRPLLEIYIHKGIHYVFNLIFYATVAAAVATVAAVAYLVISSKLKSSKTETPPAVATPTPTPVDELEPMPSLSRRSSKRRSRRASAATNTSAPPMMYPPYGFQQPWDEYNYPGAHMNMYMPPSPMYQPQLYHPVPVRPFEPPQSAQAVDRSPGGPVTPSASAFPLPPTPGHARTESGNVAAIPEVLQQPTPVLQPPKKKPVYRVVQRKVERERELPQTRPPLRARDLPPVPRELPEVPKHQGLPVVFTRFEDENSMVNYASPPTEVDLKVGDHSFKPYGSPPRRYHGMNV
ncbi:hypothetical protein CJU89_7007 [Yarrowia sp. B02]|nr:hypothetical protein CJU89_7007 [Yarrowia sp. B02]